MSEPDLSAFFNGVYSAFESAQKSVGGTVDRWYSIGGYVLRLRFAGPALVASLTPALEHRQIPPTARADLTICLWDSASTKTVMPPRPWQPDDLVARGDVRGYSDARFHTMLSGDVGALSLLDTAENLAIFWIRAADHLPMYERGSPLRAIIHWWMRQHGLVLIHAGAVGLAENGVLVVGKSGSGKSTTALACLVRGWNYVGDDYCLIAATGAPYVHSLYNSAKLTAAHIQNFPGLIPAISNPQTLGDEKALIYLYAHHPTGLVAELAVRMILVPRVTGRPTTSLTPISPISALRALAPSSLFQLPGTGQAEFLLLADFVKKVPCHSLELGTDLEQIPQAIHRVLCQ